MGFLSLKEGFATKHFYHDLWVKGATLEVGGRRSLERYEAIENYLLTLQQPLRILDLGANMGYFSFRLAERFFGDMVMVEGSFDIVPKLLKMTIMNENPQLILLGIALDLVSLKTLLQKERFDLVLALNIIHHFNEPFNEVLKTLADHTSHLIIEHVNPEEQSCHALERVRSEPLDLSPYSPQKLISTSSTGHPGTLRDIWALKGKASEEAGLEGLSLSTFKDFHGLYPHPFLIEKELEKMKIPDEEGLRLVKGKPTLPKSGNRRP